MSQQDLFYHPKFPLASCVATATYCAKCPSVRHHHFVFEIPWRNVAKKVLILISAVILKADKFISAFILKGHLEGSETGTLQNRLRQNSMKNEALKL